jgi:hypothetical protein
VFLSDGSSKTLQKTFYKKIVSKSFYKKLDKNRKPIFFDLFYHVFGRFSVRGVQKYDKRNIASIKLALVIFWPLTHPRTTGRACFFGGGSLRCRPTSGATETVEKGPRGAEKKQKTKRRTYLTNKIKCEVR